MSEAAKVLDVSYPTVKRWELSGKLNCTSQKIKGVKHYLEHEITAIKNTGIVASNMGRKKGYSRTLDKVKKVDTILRMRVMFILCNDQDLALNTLSF